MRAGRCLRVTLKPTTVTPSGKSHFDPEPTSPPGGHQMNVGKRKGIKLRLMIQRPFTTTINIAPRLATWCRRWRAVHMFPM
jgi:hypothetical protein